MLEIESARAFTLPDGSFIRVSTSGGSVNAQSDDGRIWNSLDVTLVTPDGFSRVLCAVDFEDSRGLDVLVFDEEQADPVYILKNAHKPVCRRSNAE